MIRAALLVALLLQPAATGPVVLRGPDPATPPILEFVGEAGACLYPTDPAGPNGSSCGGHMPGAPADTASADKGDGTLLTAWVDADGTIRRVRRVPVGGFRPATAAATYEDVDWSASPRHGGDALATRRYPKALRSLTGPRWRFSVDTAAPATCAFDEEGRYIPGSSAGGVLILHDHLSKSELIERSGPPVGGRYRVAFGTWFHAAEDPDLRPGFGEVGNLYLRLAATRDDAVVPDGPARTTIATARAWRVATFRTNSDGDPSGGYGDLLESEVEADRVFITPRPESADGRSTGPVALVADALDGHLTLFEGGRTTAVTLAGAADGRPVFADACEGRLPVTPPDPAGADVPFTRNAPSTSVRSAHVGADGRIYLFGSAGVRAADTRLGRGVVLVRTDRAGRRLSLRFAGPGDSDARALPALEPTVGAPGTRPPQEWRQVALPFEPLDAVPDGAGSLYVLFLRGAPLEAIDAALDRTPDHPRAAEARLYYPIAIEEGPAEPDGDGFRKVVTIRRAIHAAVVRYPLAALLAAAGDGGRSAALLPPAEAGPLSGVRVGEETLLRTLVAKRPDFSDAAWLLPSQRAGEPARIDGDFRLGATLRRPQVPLSRKTALDLVVSDATTRSGEVRLPANRTFGLLAENPPEFDPDGFNARCAPVDEDGDGIAAALPEGVIESSLIYLWSVEEYRDGAWRERPQVGTARVFDHPDRNVGFDPSSRFLSGPGFDREAAGRAERTRHPYLFTVPGLPAGRYRVTLRVGFDFSDGPPATTVRRACQELGPDGERDRTARQEFVVE